MVSQSENIARPSSSFPIFSVLKVRPQNHRCRAHSRCLIRAEIQSKEYVMLCPVCTHGVSCEPQRYSHACKLNTLFVAMLLCAQGLFHGVL